MHAEIVGPSRAYYEDMRRIPLVLCLALPVAVAAAWLHVFTPTTEWAGPVHVGASIVLAAIALATALAALPASSRTHATLAAPLLVAQLAILVASLARVRFRHYA